MSASASMLAITLSRPPQPRQCTISMANTRLSRCAQLMRTCLATAEGRFAASWPFAPRPRPEGVILARRLKRERIRVVVRRPAASTGNRSLIDLAIDGQYEQVLATVQSMFDLRRIQP